MEEYKLKFYRDCVSGKNQVLEYIEGLSDKDQSKIFKYIDLLKRSNGYLDEPYSRHITGKIRELRVDFADHHHRLFYFLGPGKLIIILSSFLKNSDKTPLAEIRKALANYQNVINNWKSYE